MAEVARLSRGSDGRTTLRCAALDRVAPRRSHPFLTRFIVLEEIVPCVLRN